MSSIMDKFDILTSSISDGLPREIDLRQKQYEYYRDLCEALSLIPGLTINFAEGKNQTVWHQPPSLIVQDKDRPGIINDISQVLTAHNIELKAITTHCKDLWQSENNHFYAKLKLTLPHDLDEARFQSDICAISDTITAELSLA